MEALACKIPVLATGFGGPSTFLPKNCMLTVYNTRYEQFGKIGYIVGDTSTYFMNWDEPEKESAHDWQPAGYTFDDFRANLKRLLDKKIEPVLTQRVI